MKSVSIYFILFIILIGCGRFEGAFSFLREPPDTKKLPGIYELDPKVYSYSSLKKQGYSDLSASFELKKDHSFSARRIPDCCIYGEYGYFGGYFDGEGTWSIEKGSSTYKIEFHFMNLRRNIPSTGNEPELFDFVSFIITADGDEYGLAAPLFQGEFQYTYFRKNNDG